MYATLTFITEALRIVTLVTATVKACYSELMSYTALVSSYWVSFNLSFNEAYQCQGHAH